MSPKIYSTLTLLSLLLSLISLLWLSDSYSSYPKLATPRVATVQLTKIIQQQVKQLAQQKEANHSASLQQFTQQLTKCLKRVAAKQQMIILISEAVVAGGDDVTSAIQQCYAAS